MIHKDLPGVRSRRESYYLAILHRAFKQRWTKLTLPSPAGRRCGDEVDEIRHHSRAAHGPGLRNRGRQGEVVAGITHGRCLLFLGFAPYSWSRWCCLTLDGRGQQDGALWCAPPNSNSKVLGACLRPRLIPPTVLRAPTKRLSQLETRPVPLGHDGYVRKAAALSSLRRGI